MIGSIFEIYLKVDWLTNVAFIYACVEKLWLPLNLKKIIIKSGI